MQDIFYVKKIYSSKTMNAMNHERHANQKMTQFQVNLKFEFVL